MNTKKKAVKRVAKKAKKKVAKKAVNHVISNPCKLEKPFVQGFISEAPAAQCKRCASRLTLH
jgi:hypothetical protein